MPRRLRALYRLAAAPGRSFKSVRGHSARQPSRAARCTPAVFKFRVHHASVVGHGGRTACPECRECVTVEEMRLRRLRAFWLCF